MLLSSKAPARTAGRSPMEDAVKKILLLAACAALVPLALLAADPTYIGSDKCKMCHKVEYTSWEKTTHATSLDVLKPEEQAKAECLKCHATGGSAAMLGVQCEACHGAGSEYKSLKVMKDPAASRAAGLIDPDEASCRSCHEGAPHDQKKVDYAAALKAGVHEVKKTE